MEEEAVVASANNEEHLIIMSCLMALYAHNGAKPRQGGSAPGTPQEQAEVEAGRLLHYLC
jgi:hypothetical protein